MKIIKPFTAIYKCSKYYNNAILFCMTAIVCTLTHEITFSLLGRHFVSVINHVWSN